MKTIRAIPAAVLALMAGTAGAQQAGSNVTLYGLVDSGVEVVTHSGTADRTLIRVPTVTGLMSSRLGFRGTEDLGDGLKALFTIEAGLGMDTGASAQGGRAWGRQAFVGLAGKWGQVALGRQPTALFYALADSDVLGPAIYAFGSIDPGVPNARADNAITYRGTFGDFTAFGSWSFGRDSAGGTPASGTCAGETAGAAMACRNWSAFLRWAPKPYGLTVAIDEQRGGTGATASFFNGAAPIAFTSADNKDRRIFAGGYVMAGDVRLGAGWMGRKVETTTVSIESDTWYAGASYPVTAALTLDGQFLRTTNSDLNRSASMTVARGIYALSKRSSVYLQTGYLDNSALAQYSVSGGGAGSTPNAGKNQLGTMVGLRHFF
ncbi:porin [Derxia gummosa]|uniref:Porin n=1 Tax=Derxia gummosa DSM 723 TaxID=1121388 RepID=A0A8B6X3E6_9BURK|nr:porin [Derxia gummosa]